MTSQKICIIMDPIETISPKKDTTFALILEAQKRRWPVHYATYDCLFLEDNIVKITTKMLSCIDRIDNFYQFISSDSTFSLNEFDIVLIRKDPPFDKSFLYMTYLLDIAKQQGCFIANDPTSIRSANEKLYAFTFPECCPETLVTCHFEPILDFILKHKSVIIKPLSHMGGYGIFKLSHDDPNVYPSIELLTKHYTLPIMVQRYLPNIAQGDKRILMIDGTPFPLCLARVPKKGDIRGNLSAGATGITQPLSARDIWIAEQIGPTLRQQGLYFVGLDVIGDHLTEINVTSPTCVREIEAASHQNICALLWDALESKIP